MFLSLCPCFALAFWVRLVAGGEDQARGGLGRGCDTHGQQGLENHKKQMYFLQRIQLEWTCTTAPQLASRIKSLLEHRSCPGTLAIAAARGTTWLVSAGAVMPLIGAVRGGKGGSRTCR